MVPATESRTEPESAAAGGQGRRSKTRRTRAWKRARVMWPVQAAALAVFWGVCAAMSPDRASRLGAWLGRRLGPRLRHHVRMQDNLAIALPGVAAAEIGRLAQEAWAGLGATLTEYPHLAAIAARAEFQCDPALEAYVDTGRPAIFVTAHFGNWEIPAGAAQERDIPMSLVYRQKDNPLVEWLVQRCRRPLGCRYLPSHEGVRPLLAELKSGRSVALLVDLQVESGDLLPFFGHPAATTLAPARLAQSVGCPLVPTHSERIRDARHRVVVEAAIWPDPAIADRQAQAREMMVRVNRAIEAWITARPQEWVATHNRWSRSVRRQVIEGQQHEPPTVRPPTGPTR